MKLTAAILASALMFFLGWWVGRLQREAERAKYYDPIAGTYHDGTAWPMRHATGGNSPYVEDDDGVQPWDPPPFSDVDVEIWREALADPAFREALTIGQRQMAAGEYRLFRDETP
jgi:hypothetical protein